MALQFNDETAAEAIKSGKLVVVDFWSTSCGPCMKLSPVIDELAVKYEGKALIGKINIEDDIEVCAEYRVRNIPAVLFFKDGELKDKSIGLVSLADLEKKLQPLL